MTEKEITVMHLPAVTRSQEEPGSILLQNLQREQGPADTLISDF